MTWILLTIAILAVILTALWESSSKATKFRWIVRYGSRVIGIRLASRLLVLNGLVVAGGANNRLYALGRQLSLVVSNPAAGAADGQACLVGQMPAVALAASGAGGVTQVDAAGVYNLPVHGVNAGGNVAVAVGDLIYYDTGTDTLSKLATGVRYGYALGAVASGATTTIPVKLGY